MVIRIASPRPVSAIIFCADRCSRRFPSRTAPYHPAPLTECGQPPLIIEPLKKVGKFLRRSDAERQAANAERDATRDGRTEPEKIGAGPTAPTWQPAGSRPRGKPPPGPAAGPVARPVAAMEQQRPLMSGIAARAARVAERAGADSDSAAAPASQGGYGPTLELEELSDGNTPTWRVAEDAHTGGGTGDEDGVEVGEGRRPGSSSTMARMKQELDRLKAEVVALRWLWPINFP